MKKIKTYKRPFIDDETASVGAGPLEFNVEVARAHGWTDQAIERFYTKVSAMVQRQWNVAQQRYPERYRRHKPNGQILFVGAIGRQPALKLANPGEWEPVGKKAATRIRKR